MAGLHLSFKRMAIDKANQKIVTVLIAGSMLSIFGLVGSRALIAQLKYQNRVISEKGKAADQLKKNVEAVDSLVTAYRAFDGAQESIIGTPERNSKIVLDALPSKYDFPALATSLEKILQGYQVGSITGTDDEVAQQSTGGSQVVEIPFEVSVTTNYQGIQALVRDFERSIRPLHILSLDISGSDTQLSVLVKAKTYYQSDKRLEIGTKVIE